MKLALTHPAPTSGAPGSASDWWHRDHPVATPLSGFFAGLAFVLLVPPAFSGLLDSLLPRHTVQDVFPLALVLTLAVPIALVTGHHSRRFGLYFAFGMAATAAVVVGVGWLVLWLMVS